MRNLQIIDYADTVIAFWDGTSKGTKFVIDKCREKGKPVKVKGTPFVRQNLTKGVLLCQGKESIQMSLDLK